MSTRVRLHREYPHRVDTFAAALADPEFHRRKLDVDGSGRIEIVDFHHEEPRSGAGDRPDDRRPRIVVVLRQPVPTGQVPRALERLVSGSLVIDRTERWSLGAQGCDGGAEVRVPMTPIRATGRMSVRAREGGSRLEVDLDVSATVPLLGQGIERSVVAGIRGLTGAEHGRISTWLDRAEGRR